MKNKIILTTLSIILMGTTFNSLAQINQLPIMNKPTFFKKETVENKPQIILSKIKLSEKELADLGIKKEEIDKFTNYYLEKTKEYFSSKKQNGYVGFDVKVISRKENKSEEECLKSPTDCSRTSTEFFFSKDFSNEEAKEFFTYITGLTQKDGIEIFVNNHSSQSTLHFNFEIYLNEQSMKQYSNDGYPKEKKIEIDKNKQSFKGHNIV